MSKSNDRDEAFAKYKGVRGYTEREEKAWDGAWLVAYARALEDAAVVAKGIVTTDDVNEVIASAIRALAEKEEN